MTEVLPNWNLKDFYESIDDERIQADLKQFEQFAKKFSIKIQK
jgi:hypothetical protein